MTTRPRIRGRLKRETAARDAAAAAPGEDADVSTPYGRLLRAAERGQFESVVREARPEQPLAMVTPEEREADLRAAGVPSAAEPEPQPAPDPPDPPPPELSITEQYHAEHCWWRKRTAADDIYDADDADNEDEDDEW